MALEVLKAGDYQTEVHNDWCPGCGDFGILRAVQMTLSDMKLRPHEVALFSGIGCSAKTVHYMNTFGVHTLHGRVLPYAQGARLANPNLNVVALGGDGDGLSIGVGHFVNSGRRNVDMLYIIHDNGVYGLTKGQASPTLGLGLQPKSLPAPNLNAAVNPVWLALASGCTWVARSYSFDVKHLRETMAEGIRHRGFAFLQVLQPCPTYNNINSKDWYGGSDRRAENEGRPMPRVYTLEGDGWDPVVREPGEAPAKILQGIEKGAEWGDRIPIGVFYRNEHVPTYEQRIAKQLGGYLDRPPSRQTLRAEDGRPTASIRALIEELRVT